MRIVVCVKQVPDTTEVRIDPETNTLQREGVPSILNPFDAHAVEAASRLKNAYGGEVIAVCMGPPQAREVLSKAVSLGADHGILLSDRAFAGADTLATSYTLAQAIKKLHEQQAVDIVLCGKQAIDGDTAQVGPGIAVRLKFSQLSYVKEIREINLESKEIIVVRKLEGGEAVVKAKLPALLTVVKDINELTYSSLPAMIAAARFKAEIWTKEKLDPDTEQLGLKGSPTSVRKIFAPPQKEGGEIIKSNPKEAVRQLVEKLITSEILADR